MTEAAFLHGGALDAAMHRYGGARQDWLDLSTGINPVPPPLPALSPDAWARLPEAGDEERLLSAARSFYGRGEAIVAAPGSQALISAWPRLFAPCRAAVLSPTYGEHAASLRAAGHAVLEIADLDAVPDDVRLLVVVNPNNPDGRLSDPAQLRALAGRLVRRGGLLVVDEAFMDATPEQSLAGEAVEGSGLLVLKSFGKYFGLAGLRLGFAFCGATLARRLSAQFGPWAVSGPALAIGAALLQAEAQTGHIRADLHVQARRTAEVLQSGGLTVRAMTPFFCLVDHEDAHRLHQVLAARHVLTRPFAYAQRWLRIGNLADDAAADRLRLRLAERP